MTLKKEAFKNPIYMKIIMKINWINKINLRRNLIAIYFK